MEQPRKAPGESVHEAATPPAARRAGASSQRLFLRFLEFAADARAFQA
jgi:hypothetical protein